MGKISVEFSEHYKSHDLFSSTRIGRHWSNSVQIHTVEMPLYWLEIRWSNDTWQWRTLSSEGETIGMGAALLNKWRALQKNQTIRLEGGALIRCIDDSPPELLVEVLEQGNILHGDDLLKVVEVHKNTVFPLGEVDTVASLKDGDIFNMGNHLFRIHIPIVVQTTEHHILHVEDPTLWLEIDLKEQKATFGNAHQEVTITGISVLLLYTYAKPIESGTDWLSAEMAYQHWLSIGGNVKSSKNRMSWERGKLRNKLSKMGIGGSKELFVSRTIEGLFEFKLNLTQEQIHLNTES